MKRNRFLGTIVVLFVFIIALNYSCDPKEKNNQTSQVESIDSLSPDKKKIREQIQLLVDSSKQYMLTDETRWEALISNALDLASRNELWSEYIKIHRFQRVTYLGYFHKIRDWKDELVKIDSLIQAHENSLGRDAVVLRNSMKTQWAMYYSYLGDHHQAIHLIKEAITELQRFPLDSAVAYNLQYNSSWLSFFYRKIGSYEAAIQEGNRELKFLDQEKKFLADPDLAHKTGTYASLATAYLEQGKTTKAFEYYQKAELELKKCLSKITNLTEKRSLYINIYTGFANYFTTINQHKKALPYLEKIKSFLRKNDGFYVKNLINIGDVNLQEKNYDAAQDAYQEAEEILAESYGNKNYRLASANLKIAHLCGEEQRWEAALSYYQKAIGNVIVDFNEFSDYRRNPDKLEADKILGNIELVHALQGKTEALSKLYEEKQDIAYLENAQQASSLSIELIDLIKDNLFLDEDRQFQVSDHFPVYENGLNISDQLFDLTGDSSYLEKSFSLFEKSKSLSLISVFNPSFNQNPALSALLERERQLKYEIAKREEFLIDKSLPLNEDSVYLALQDLYQAWSDKIKAEKPEYFRFKNNTETIPCTSVRESLDSSQAFLEYFWGEHELFSMLITHDQIKVYKKAIGSLEDSIRLAHDLASDPGWSTNIEKNVAFQNLSHYLFTRIIEEPLEALSTSYNRLIIVRDGPLEFIPFEILDVSPETQPGIFAPQEFLLSRFTIAYANSATILNYQYQHQAKKNLKNFVGFAPSYKGKVDTVDNGPLAYLSRSGSIELKATKDEVNAISKLVGGDIYTEDQATERRFKRSAKDYRILHLAMHALPDKDQPEFSELLFAVPNHDTAEDGHLRAIELYNMKLNAQVAVLSACATGFGKLLQGEGIMSLGYAFTYAGIPSLVVSLWNADDKNTSILMTRFYSNLKKGMPKDQALTQAKLTFLNDYPELAHPYYWSTFITIGNTSPIKFTNRFPMIGTLAAVALLVLVFFNRKKLFALFSRQ